MIKIGNLAACDRHNYGDLLYPLFIQKMLQIRGWEGEIDVYSFLKGMAPGDAGYKVQNMNDILKSRRADLDYLVVGGGDIIRTDTKTIASHYFIDKSPYSTDYNNQTIQKVIKKIKKKLGVVEKDKVASFVKDYMIYSSISPYILNSTEFSETINSIIYCSCGVPFELEHDPRKNKIKEAFDNASFIYVRDKTSMERLIQIGVEKEIHVAPDLIITMSDFFEVDQYKERGLSILKKYCKIDYQKKILVFQTFQLSEKEGLVIIDQLKKYKYQNDVEIVLTPIGYCNKDHLYLKKLSQLSDGVLKYAGVYSIFDILSVIAASDIFVGTSLHGNITAFSFGIPHLFGPIPVSKAEGFLDLVNLPRELKLSSWLELDEKLNMVDKIEEDFFASRALAAKKRIHHTFDILFDVMQSKIVQPANKEIGT